MIIIYNQNGTVDLSATRECLLGNPCEEDLDQDGELEDFSPAKEEEDSETDYQEFWNDPCWTEPPGPIG